MNQAQKDLRRAAARAFMESLDALASRLSAETENPNHATTNHPTPTVPKAPQKPLVKELEEAVADIEQYNQS